MEITDYTKEFNIPSCGSHLILFPKNIFFVIAGSTGSGKTNWMLNLLEKEKLLEYNHVHVYSSTQARSQTWANPGTARVAHKTAQVAQIVENSFMVNLKRRDPFWYYYLGRRVAGKDKIGLAWVSSKSWLRTWLNTVSTNLWISWIVLQSTQTAHLKRTKGKLRLHTFSMPMMK